MRATRLLALALAAASLAAAAAASAATPSGIFDVRVCSAGSFDEGASACRRDESRRPLRSGKAYCTAKIGRRKGQRLRGRFLYEGRGMPESSLALAADEASVWLDVSVGELPLPGGRWVCRLGVGRQTVERRFTSGGPRGALVDVAVCPTSRTVVAGPVRVCRGDERRRPLARGPFTCSGVFPGSEGMLARLELRYRGRATGIGLERRLPLPVTAFGAQFTSRRGFPAGSYSCRFTLAGRVVGEARFSLR